MTRANEQKTAAAALECLKLGNSRFVAGEMTHPAQSAARRSDLAENGQQPFAVILGCADSRIAPEVIFDQGLGDLFVIRVAGNIVDETVLASIEYAAAHLATPLILVLGHSKCGAVGAALAGGELEGNLPGLIKRITPVLEQAAALPGDKNENAEKANALAMADRLRTTSPVLAKLVAAQSLTVATAYYHQSTGIVDYLD